MGNVSILRDFHIWRISTIWIDSSINLANGSKSAFLRSMRPFFGQENAVTHFKSLRKIWALCNKKSWCLLPWVLWVKRQTGIRHFQQSRPKWTDGRCLWVSVSLTQRSGTYFALVKARSIDLPKDTIIRPHEICTEWIIVLRLEKIQQPPKIGHDQFAMLVFDELLHAATMNKGFHCASLSCIEDYSSCRSGLDSSVWGLTSCSLVPGFSVAELSNSLMAIPERAPFLDEMDLKRQAMSDWTSMVFSRLFARAFLRSASIKKY